MPSTPVRRLAFVCLLPASFVLAGCAHPAPPEAAAAAPSAASTGAGSPGAALPDGTLPRLSTPEQLRAAIPQGTKMVFRITRGGGAPVMQHWEFTHTDATSATIHSVVKTEAGTLVEDEGEEVSTWAELVEHAAFPAAETTVGDSVVDVPAGHFVTRRYTVRATGPDGAAQLKRYDFAPALLGPPVLYVILEGGTEVFRMELIERSPLPS